MIKSAAFSDVPAASFATTTLTPEEEAAKSEEGQEPGHFHRHRTIHHLIPGLPESPFPYSVTFSPDYYSTIQLPSTSSRPTSTSGNQQGRGGAPPSSSSSSPFGSSSSSSFQMPPFPLATISTYPHHGGVTISRLQLAFFVFVFLFSYFDPLEHDS